MVGLIGVLIILSACKSQKPDIITYELSRKDFTERIFGIGTLESANNYTIISPRVYSPALKVLELAPEGSIAKEGDTICKLEASDIYGFYDRYYKEVEQVKADLIKQEANNALQLGVLNSQLKENSLKTKFSSLDSVQLQFAPAVKRQILELELKRARFCNRKS